MIKYETLFIIKPDLPEDEVQAVLDRLQDRVARVNGKTASISHWGNMELAYPVRYRGEVFHRGYYILFTYVGDGAAVDEVERNLKILDTPFRYVTVRLASGIDPESITEVEVVHQGPRTSVRGGYRNEGDEGEDEGGRRGRGRYDRGDSGGDFSSRPVSENDGSGDEAGAGTGDDSGSDSGDGSGSDSGDDSGSDSGDGSGDESGEDQSGDTDDGADDRGGKDEE